MSDIKFTAEDFRPCCCTCEHGAIHAADIANTKIAPLVADKENLLERVRDLYDLQGRIARQHDGEINILRDQLTAIKAKLEVCLQAIKASQLAISRLHGDGQGGVCNCPDRCGICGVFKSNREAIEELGRKA